MLSFSNLPTSLPANIYDALLDFVRGAKGCLGVVSAKTTQHGDGDDEGRYLIMVGWESVEAHEQAKSAVGFAKLPLWVWRKVKVHHIRWEEITADGEIAKARF